MVLNGFFLAGSNFRTCGSHTSSLNESDQVESDSSIGVLLCSLAEEVIAAAGSEEAARSALADASSAQTEHRQAQQQLMACTEMLGEKEERLEELRADLQDVKQLYKDQIEFMVEQLAHLTQQQKEKQPEVQEIALEYETSQ